MLEQSYESEDGPIYRGHHTKLIGNELGFNNSYVTYIRRTLEGMGCIQQLIRGGPHQMSKWRLVREPTLELFQERHYSTTPPRSAQAQRDRVFDERFIRVEEDVRLLRAKYEILEDKVDRLLELLEGKGDDRS